ncbi:MAG: NAD(P)-dependent glycerol-3-phosphate dehydrogenase [Chitinophagales bacterium]|nr:NAD(P)-dependent glycerol-3-phosphate dehydrogenase [Bacteroidota bacterium]MCB9256879.1 NAD(P)-dependent glycerol-3-phosphate dehydrogenase [Chitinophagales bacterium]
MDLKNTSHKFGVIGAGSFGIAIANLLAENGKVLLYTRNEEQRDSINQKHLSRDLKIHENVEATTELKSIAEECFLIFPIIPSDNFVELLDALAPYLNASHILIHGTKGLYTPKKLGKDIQLKKQEVFTMSELIKLKTGVVRVGCLAGPNLASELSELQPAATVIASSFNEVIEIGQQALRSTRFQVYGSNELLGVELAGVLKNYVAIASGMLTGLGYGENARALLITRGMAELIHIAKALGASERAFLGLAGIGDLIATCHSNKSRNFRVGLQLAQGKNLDQIIEDLGEVAEGVKTLIIIRSLQNYGYKAPLAEILYKIVFENFPIHKGIGLLMRFSAEKDAEYIV